MINTLDQLKRNLDKLNISYEIKSTGNLFQFQTLTYWREGKVFHCDAYNGGKIIGIWR